RAARQARHRARAVDRRRNRTGPPRACRARGNRWRRLYGGDPPARGLVTERVLLVEDDAGLRRTLGDRLRRERYEVAIAEDGDSGLALASERSFDCVILDVQLPGRDGFAVCCALREADNDVPVLFLTARDTTLDKVTGLRLGADDYVTKPFQMIELIARL